MRSDRYAADSAAEKKKKKKRRPLKVLFLLILLLAVSIAGVTAYSYFKAYNSLTVTFTEDFPEVEFGGDYPSMDFVKDSWGEITADAGSLDTDTVGKAEMTYTAVKPVLGGLLQPYKNFTLSYTVADKVAPIKIWSGDGTIVKRGEEFDINNFIAYGDNADPAPAVSVDGKVDTEKNGEYPLHVTVTDSSGNSTGWDLSVVVADELPYYEDTAARTDFADFVKANKKKGRSFGIDVSAWQDEVDFKAVKKAGCEFVMIRIGYSYDGEITIDKRFKNNLKGAREAGLKTGVYFYSTDYNEELAASAADWIIETLGGTTLDLPVAFDWEDFTSFQSYGISIHDLNRMYDAFAAELAGDGYGCMLYGSKTYLENIWEKTDTRPVWLAHYTEKTDYKGPYILWQASSTGRISGIDGDVDMDILYNNN